jgi:hypothetical protein
MRPRSIRLPKVTPPTPLDPADPNRSYWRNQQKTPADGPGRYDDDSCRSERRVDFIAFPTSLHRICEPGWRATPSFDLAAGPGVFPSSVVAKRHQYCGRAILRPLCRCLVGVGRQSESRSPAPPRRSSATRSAPVGAPRYERAPAGCWSMSSSRGASPHLSVAVRAEQPPTAVRPCLFGEVHPGVTEELTLSDTVLSSPPPST